MTLARYPHLKDEAAVQAIATRLGGEEPREYFMRRFIGNAGDGSAMHMLPNWRADRGYLGPLGLGPLRACRGIRWVSVGVR